MYIKQRFCVSNKISHAELLKILEYTYGKWTLSKRWAYEWHKAFREGQKVVEDLPHSDQPSMSFMMKHCQSKGNGNRKSSCKLMKDGSGSWHVS